MSFSYRSYSQYSYSILNLSWYLTSNHSRFQMLSNQSHPSKPQSSAVYMPYKATDQNEITSTWRLTLRGVYRRASSTDLGTSRWLAVEQCTACSSPTVPCSKCFHAWQWTPRLEQPSTEAGATSTPSAAQTIITPFSLVALRTKTISTVTINKNLLQAITEISKNP